MGLADHNTLVYVEAGGGKLIIGNADGTHYVEITVDTSGNLVITDNEGNAAVIVTNTGNITPA